MRNFHRGGFRNNSSNFSRNERRSDRGGGRGDFRPRGDPYKRPSDKFGRGIDRPRPRRDFDSPRGSHNQDRRDGPRFRDHGGRDRSLSDRFKPQRFFRDQTPPRSRDYDARSSSRHRSDEGRFRRSPQPATSSFRMSDMKSRSIRGGLTARRGTRPAGRITSKNDLRSGLIAKRSDPAQRSKEYIKKIRQARLKLSEKRQKSLADDDDDDDNEPKTPPRENEKDAKPDDNDEVLDVANDVDFEEDEDDVGGKASKSDDKEKSAGDKPAKSEKSEKKSEADVSGTSEKSKRREKSPSKEPDRSCSFELTCVHCSFSCTTIQDYRKHQNRRDHLLAMKKVSIKARMTLNKLRKVQRERQLEIEARVKNVENIPSKYCQVCKLYFRQTKIEHKESEDHKKIRNFLKPWCKICNLHFVGPMKYEIHKCSVSHLRKKARNNDSADDEDAEIGDVDLSEYKTVDSVGDVDGEEVESAIDNDFEEEEDGPVGQSFINKVEVNYCSLCREYLSRGAKDEKIIEDHCKSKKHLKWYYQSKKKEEKETPTKKSEESASSSKDDAAKPTTSSEASKSSKKHNSENDDVKIKTKLHDEEDEDEENDKNDSKSQDEASEKNSKKFTRYFEQSSP